jgi:hypothetical protein
VAIFETGSSETAGIASRSFGARDQMQASIADHRPMDGGLQSAISSRAHGHLGCPAHDPQRQKIDRVERARSAAK